MNKDDKKDNRSDYFVGTAEGLVFSDEDGKELSEADQKEWLESLSSQDEEKDN